MLKLPERSAQNQDVTLAAVKAWFDQEQGWLLIIDNADSLSMIHDVLPVQSQGHILLTTRDPVVATIATLLTVGEMTLEEGATFLIRRAKLPTLESPLTPIPPDIHLQADECLAVLA